MAVTTIDVPRVNGGRPALHGYGAQLNTYVFTQSGVMTRGNQAQDLSEADRRKLAEKIRGIAPGHCRIFVQRGLDPTPGRGQQMPAWHALHKTVELAQQAGATVNLTWWGQGPYAIADRLRNLSWPNPNRTDWPNPAFQKWPTELTAPDGPSGIPGPRDKMRRFAAIVHELRKDFDCVTHATIQNEVNGAGRDIAFKGNANLSMRLYEHLYREFDEALRALHDPQRPAQTMRDAITITAGDLLQGKGGNDQDDWIRYLHANMDVARDGMPSVLDAYSIHVYWKPEEFPTKAEARLEHLADLLDSLGTKKPVYVTEYGVRQIVNPASDRPGVHRPTGLPMEHAPEAAFQHAWFNALAPQRRCVGLVKWVMYRSDLVNGWGKWGVIDSPRDGLGVTPTYHVMRLFNGLVDKDWFAGGGDHSGDGLVLVSRFSGPGGGESVVALNRDDRPREVKLTGLGATRYRRFDWNRGGRGKLDTVGDTPAPGNSVTVSIPPRGVMALTTRPLVF